MKIADEFLYILPFPTPSFYTTAPYSTVGLWVLVCLPPPSPPPYHLLPALGFISFMST